MPTPSSKPTPKPSDNRSGGGGKRARRSFREMDDTAPTWDDVPTALVASIVRMWTTQGASPTFGYTRNGRSLTLAVYWKGERDVQYLGSAEEVRDYHLFLAREWFGLSDDEISAYPLSDAQID